MTLAQQMAYQSNKKHAKQPYSLLSYFSKSFVDMKPKY